MADFKDAHGWLRTAGPGNGKSFGGILERKNRMRKTNLVTFKMDIKFLLFIKRHGLSISEICRKALEKEVYHFVGEYEKEARKTNQVTFKATPKLLHLAKAQAINVSGICRKALEKEVRDTLTSNDWKWVESAVRLRAEAAEENGDMKRANQWRYIRRKILSKIAAYPD